MSSEWKTEAASVKQQDRLGMESVFDFRSCVAISWDWSGLYSVGRQSPGFNSGLEAVLASPVLSGHEAAESKALLQVEGTESRSFFTVRGTGPGFNFRSRGTESRSLLQVLRKESSSLPQVPRDGVQVLKTVSLLFRLGGSRSLVKSWGQSQVVTRSCDGVQVFTSRLGTESRSLPKVLGTESRSLPQVLGKSPGLYFRSWGQSPGLYFRSWGQSPGGFLTGWRTESVLLRF
ncbi:unnamed protein product [Pleuronectes platessa]|uniref:Uncharacterized protein n=1 Tax=Pleuronectes platessa TaxID=8262 RepID=A0A9N7UAX2_PLEPL|nr:unnamed protein product [Pleuronectes platessa]